MVRSSSAPQGSGLLGPGGSTPFHELERTDGSFFGSAEIPTPLGGEVCTSPVGQHHDSGLSEETGLCPVSPSSHPVHEDFGVLQGQQHCHRSDSPQRGVERPGRSGFETQADRDGMDA